METTLNNFELKSKSSIRSDITRAIKDFMTISLDEWIRDYLPQVSVTAFSAILTGEITQLLTENEIK